jgi:hypothetical protein
MKATKMSSANFQSGVCRDRGKSRGRHRVTDKGKIGKFTRKASVNP